MKKLIFTLILALFSLGLFTPVVADAAIRVRGYYRSNGTYVRPYYRSNSDSYRFNNYSSKGNYNPYTGRKGYKSWY